LRHRAGVDDGARPFLRALLRQVVSGAAKKTMLMSADELDRVMLRSRVHAVHVAVDRNGRNGNGRLRGERRFDGGACRVRSIAEGGKMFFAAGMGKPLMGSRSDLTHS
jgi:hypothetical protein